METPELFQIPQDVQTLYGNLEVYNSGDNQYLSYQPQLITESNSSEGLEAENNVFTCKSSEFLDVKIETTDTIITETRTNDDSKRNKSEDGADIPLSVQLHVGNKHFDTENVQKIKCETIENLQSEHVPNEEDENMAVEALRQLGNSLYSTATSPRIETKTPRDLPLLPCPNCDMEFRTTADLNSHAEICKHSQFHCSICSKTFYRQLDLNNHLVCHAVERPHACRICSTLFVHKNDLQQHMVTHGSEIGNQCQVCGLFFNRGSSLTNHMKIHNYQTERNLGKSEEFIDSLRVDVEEKGLENIEEMGQWNVYCDSETLNTGIHEDIEVEGQVVTSSQVKTFSCAKCDKIFNSAKSLDLHEAVHAERTHVCSICNSSFIKKQDFKRHMTTHDVLYDCNICGVVFNRPSSLTNHMKIHNYPAKRLISTEKIEDNLELAEILTSDGDIEPPEKIVLPSINNMTSLNWNLYYESEVNSVTSKPDSFKATKVASSKPYACSQCDKTFAREKALESHLILHKDVLQSYLNCTRCEKTFTNENELKHHEVQCVRKATGKAPRGKQQENLSKTMKQREIKSEHSFKHECKSCDKRFNTKQKLFRHSWTHRLKSYSCEVCEKTFRKPELLDSHRLANHQTDSLHICNECGKNFASRQGLWEHKKMHSSDTVYKCLECPKTFTSRQGFLIHNRKHRGERPYGCSYCWKAFRDGGTLRKHERIHTGERPHACPLCTKAFNQKVVLREHLRCMHVANMKTEVGEEEFVCQICQEKIAEKDDLCAHFIKHSDRMARIARNASKKNIASLVEEKFDCDLCGQTYNNKDELHEHIRIHI